MKSLPSVFFDQCNLYQSSHRLQVTLSLHAVFLSVILGQRLCFQDTACSSSLVCCNMAMAALRSNTCTGALVLGVNVQFNPYWTEAEQSWVRLRKLSWPECGHLHKSCIHTESYRTERILTCTWEGRELCLYLWYFNVLHVPSWASRPLQKLECFLQLDDVGLETTRQMATSEECHWPGESKDSC